MGDYRYWSKEEVDLLIARHGSYSLKKTAEVLGRSLDAVKNKARRLGLGPNRYAYEYIIRNDLAKALKIENSTIRMFAREGLRIRKKVPCDKRVHYFIKLEDFWEWASNHKDLIDWTKLEENLLGKEPGWVNEERRKIIARTRPGKNRGRWTEEELKILIELYKTKECKEISEITGRSIDSIYQKLCKSKGTHKKVKQWTYQELKFVHEQLKLGKSYKEIGAEIGRTACAVENAKKKIKGLNF